MEPTSSFFYKKDQTSGNATLCYPCPIGTYGDAVGLTTAVCSDLCPSGRYGSLAGLTTSNCTGECTPLSGKYCPAGATTSAPLLCPAGRYSVLGSVGQCDPCPAGFSCPIGSINTSALCSVGQYSIEGSSCSPCPIGRYSNVTGSSACLDCPAGRNCAGAGTSVPPQCMAGQYSSSNSSSCKPCTTGRYGSAAGLTSANCSGVCVAVAGRFCGAAVSTGNGAACPIGQYNDGTNSTACILCPAGQFERIVDLTSP